VLTGLGETCETINVCGEPRAICAAREFSGTNYFTLAATVLSPDGYPAFFCSAAPTDEPTCRPTRPGEFTGLRTPGDGDGDGFGNDTDNCPQVFNPVRPQIDGFLQADSDSDGLGDACDPTPLASDLDGDSVRNELDNCPWDANQDQADGDGDGKGDVCDACPAVSNPDTSCPAQGPVEATIVEIQTGTIAVGTTVTIRDVVVTGVGSSTFHVQDPNFSPDTRFSGITIYTGGAPGVVVDDQVDVTGDVEEFFGDTELENATVVVTGTSSPIVATPVTVAEAATEAYEGVLVTLTDGVMTDPAYDCSVTPPCTDSGLWEIDGPNGVLVYDRYYEEADWSSQIGVLPVTGVMMYRFDRRRVMPRTASDFR